MIFLFWIRDWWCVLKISETQWITRRSMLTQSDPQFRVCVFSFDNRISSNSSLQYLKQHNEKYCQTHGYTFLFFDTYPADLPLYWMKVKIAYDLLRNNQYDVLMWIDSDVAIYDHEICVEQMFKLNPKVFFIKSPDNDQWASDFNSGVWVVKRCEQAQRFFQEWLDSFTRTKWVKQEQKWECIDCAWAGMEYEQGIGDMMCRKYHLNILTLDWKILQGYNTAGDKPFTLHFSGNLKIQMNQFISQMKRKN